jgi:hypothetical protein
MSFVLLYFLGNVDDIHCLEFFQVFVVLFGLFLARAFQGFVDLIPFLSTFIVFHNEVPERFPRFSHTQIQSVLTAEF